jgi:hypothetical protein
MSTRASPVDPKRFIEVWQTSRDMNEVCDRLGLQPNSASQRACNMRARGVELKRMGRKNAASNEELRKLALDLQDADTRSPDKAADDKDTETAPLAPLPDPPGESPTLDWTE